MTCDRAQEGRRVQQSLRFQPTARIGLLVLCVGPEGEGWGRVGERGGGREGEAEGERKDRFGCRSLTFTLLVLLSLLSSLCGCGE